MFFKLESGILDRTRLLANILMLILLAGNLYFTTIYVHNLTSPPSVVVDNTGTRIQLARFLREYITIVLNTKTAVSNEDRVKLENDVLQLKDADIIKEWRLFVDSKDPMAAQQNAIDLMSLVTTKMLP